MKVELLTPYTPTTVPLETGATLEVTTAKGLELIANGIAKQVGDEVPARVANAALYKGCQPPTPMAMAAALAESQKTLEVSAQDVYTALAFEMAKNKPSDEGTQSDEPRKPPTQIKAGKK